MATFSAIGDITITTASITDGNGRIGSGVDNATNEYQRIHWYSRMESGGTAPTADTVIEFYFFREDDHGTVEYTTDGIALSNLELGSSNIIENAHMIGAMVLTNDAAKFFYAEGVVEDPGPGRWTIGFMNETGQTLSTTEADGFIHWVGEKA